MEEKLFPSKIDLPVLLIFFSRPDTFSKVFSAVKKARPSKLFLACDGPRKDRSDDIEKINLCKKIAEDIDWECDVYTNYAKENMGCGLRPQTAIGWALSIVDRIAILEDDCIPDESFFGYMAELLEKYKDDNRVLMVSGLNHFYEWECDKYSYFFSNTGAIWGWGTWSRVWKNYSYNLKEIENPYIKKLLQNSISPTIKNSRIRTWKKTYQMLKKGENISYWDSQFGFLHHSQHALSIIPKNNLITNIGIGESSTHALSVDLKSWKNGILHNMPTKSISLPLEHPDFIICDRQYDAKVEKKWEKTNAFSLTCKNILRKVLRLFKQ